MRDIKIISLGENCLIDEILKDFKLRKETFPFGSGRFNIEYILSICKDDFKNLLNTQYLRYAEVEGIRVVKNSFYSSQNSIYHSTVCDDVEFTHHDLFQPKIRESLERKIQRFQLALENPQDFVFMYYYRYSDFRNSVSLIEELKKWIAWVENKSKQKPRVVLISQELIDNRSQRRVKVKKHDWGLEATLHTLDIWTGPEQWSAPQDRDLFDELLNANTTLQFMYGEDWFLEKIRRKIQKIRDQFNQLKFRIKAKIKKIVTPLH
jgi:hypothetical protein